MSGEPEFYTYTRDEFMEEFVHPDDRAAVEEARQKRVLQVRAEYLTEMRKKAGMTQAQGASRNSASKPGDTPSLSVRVAGRGWEYCQSIKPHGLPAAAAQDPGGASLVPSSMCIQESSAMRSRGTTAAAPPQPSDLPASSRGSDYAELSRHIRQAGLMERRPWYYVCRITVTVILLAVGWAAFVMVGNSWWQLAVAAFLAAILTQVGFLGHDAGHRQISGSPRVSTILGVLLGDFGIGMSYGWWVRKHTRHHAHPNTEGADPDISVGALAFTPGQVADSRGLASILFRFQAYLFFPLLLGEALNLHVASIRALADRSSRNRLAEAALLAAHIAGFLAIVFLMLPPLKAAVFIVVNQGLFGLYLGASFAPNHKGMPLLDADDQPDFLRRQVLTSRNVTGGWLTDLALGGLNYQIEHHLFPSMPRPNLRRAQPLIMDFCRQKELPYCQASLTDSYAQALRHLNTVGKATRQGDGAG